MSSTIRGILTCLNTENAWKEILRNVLSQHRLSRPVRAADHDSSVAGEVPVTRPLQTTAALKADWWRPRCRRRKAPEPNTAPSRAWRISALPAPLSGPLVGEGPDTRPGSVQTFPCRWNRSPCSVNV
ncbi:hypothetical protein Bbelb_395370 [Branchiostoma belcheri]|nr:hypothetical protein Bbelb_395370 [Branchiostoma belcheri]